MDLGEGSHDVKPKMMRKSDEQQAAAEGRLERENETYEEGQTRICYVRT